MSGPVAEVDNLPDSNFDQQGIDIVPPEKRDGRPKDLFFLWAGTTTNIFTVSYGAMLVLLFGLNFWQALTAIVLGNLFSYPLLALASVQGPATGTTNMTISRAWLGPRGGRPNGVFSWLMLLGFEAAGLILVYYAVAALLSLAGISLGSAGEIVLIAALGILQMLLPLIGYHLLMVAQKYAAIIFAGAFCVLAVVIIPRTNIFDATAGATTATLISAISFVAISGGLSWACSGSNFSRYLPRDTRPGEVGIWAALGGFIPYLLLQTLGAAMATVAVDATVDLSDPLAIPAILPAGFAIPFLLLVAFGLLLQNSTNLYSSSLNLLTAGIPARRSVVVVTDSLICIAATILAVSHSAFYQFLSAFVGSLSIWLAPWVTIYLLNWALKRGKYDLAGLMNIKGGPYWGWGGIQIPGFCALAAGMLAAALFANTGYFVGSIAAALSPANPAAAPDLAIPAGICVSALIYLSLEKIMQKNKGEKC